MQTKKLKYLLLFAVIAIAAAVAWYFAYWVKTPQYSLGLIGSAVQKHDFAAFEKHVDMETLYSSAYDDVVVASFGNERLSSPILAALVQNIKGVAVPILIDQTRQYVNGGTMEEADPSDADSPMLQNNGSEKQDRRQFYAVSGCGKDSEKWQCRCRNHQSFRQRIRQTFFSRTCYAAAY